MKPQTEIQRVFHGKTPIPADVSSTADTIKDKGGFQNVLYLSPEASQHPPA